MEFLPYCSSLTLTFVVLEPPFSFVCLFEFDYCVILVVISDCEQGCLRRHPLPSLVVWFEHDLHLPVPTLAVPHLWAGKFPRQAG